VDIRIHMKADSPYFTSSLEISFDPSDEKPFLFGIQSERAFFSKSARFLHERMSITGKKYKVYECSRDSKFILLSRNIFTGSDVDFPLVRSKFNFPFLLENFEGGMVLVEIVLPKRWKVRYGYYDSPLSFLKIRSPDFTRKIDLHRDPGKLEYGKDINIYRFYPILPSGELELEVNLLITPYWKFTFLRFIPWLQTAATLVLTSPLFQLSPRETLLAYISLYSGYLAFLYGSDAPLFSSMEVHWILILLLLTSVHIVLSFVLPPQIYLIALGGYITLLVSSLYEITKFYFKGELSGWFRKLYAKIPHKIIVRLMKFFTKQR